MNVKSLLLGSAAAVLAVSGARAADAIIIAEPEPMEYVRVCDMYGAGFFYIPGTETCLKIGGYVRYEMLYDNVDQLDAAGAVVESYRFAKLARFAPTFTAKNETEWGTLTGHAEIEFDWYSATWNDDGVFEDRELVDNSNSVSPLHIYMTLESGPSTILVGKTETPYSRFLDFAGPTMWEGRYGYNDSGEVSYTYTGANGFSAIIAAVEGKTGKFEPGIEAGVNFARDWGSIGAIAGYDTFADSWGAKAVGRFTVPSTAVDATLQVFYSSPDMPGAYHILDPYEAATEWSVLAGASVAFNDKIGVSGTVQWFDTDAWEASVNLPWTPVDGLAITPEVVYATAPGEEDIWFGRIRFQRSF